MGNACSGSHSSEKYAARARDKRIEEMNKKSFESENQKIKLLLLGAGESGKSTLFKQMKILYGTKDGQNGFSDEERKNMKAVVYQNIIFNLKQLLLSPNIKTKLENVKETTSPSSETESNLSSKDIEDIKSLLMLNSKFHANEPNLQGEKIAEKILRIWNHQFIQNIWKTRSTLQVQDALEYYLRQENFNRIIQDGYIPTDQDILRSRVRTSGIVEEHFKMDGNIFLMVDVGGQRNERRKWIHAFDTVDCVIFVAAVSEYDQVLYEDTAVKRQDESIELFEKVATDQVFNNAGLVLFLNKSDLFRKKLLTVPFRVESDDPFLTRNADYSGPTVESIKPTNMSYEDFEKTEEFNEVYLQSLYYLEELYRKKAPTGKDVHIKTTCATDTEQVNQHHDRL